MAGRHFKVKTRFLFMPQKLPALWNSDKTAMAYLAVVIWTERNIDEALREIFPDAKSLSDLPAVAALARVFRNGVSNPLAQSLASVLKIPDAEVRADQLILAGEFPDELTATLQKVWREPSIEDVHLTTLDAWAKNYASIPKVPARRDDSWDTVTPEAIGLEFEPGESAALNAAAESRGRPWNRCELELFAQTWSEHCKHKIFAARIDAVDTLNATTHSLFKTHIRQPTFEIMDNRPNRYLSVFHDNAGVIALDAADGSPTEWAACLKMETHNSPSAISPYGGASTGVVGVHRDILGTGLGAMPIANWDVLCFESPSHKSARPESALPPDIIRLGVLKGIEDGGNQSGIPTVQGSVVFDPSFAVKPLVFAGAVGILPKKFVNKKPAPGQKLYAVGGAVGADGLRGAVMSSRDLRAGDFSGSIVQVANAFVQRRVTDFLLDARDQGLIDSITDNGAGGLASSVGEMASSTGGAEIDLTHLRLKFQGLHGWERLLSESQERMTVATAHTENFEALAKAWDVPFDRLGELTNSGNFKVNFQGKVLVDISLEFLHDGCPPMHLKTTWTRQQEKEILRGSLRPERVASVIEDFPAMLASEHLTSREGVVRRFDHEVQGRTLRKPFAGKTQHSPQDGTLLEVFEAGPDVGLALSHGLAPWRPDIEENILFSFDEALRSAVLAGARLETAGLLDNFCWADPIRNERRLWRLVRACETLSALCRAFQLPLISGKDSMKNNSKDFQVLETVVISLGASVGSKLHTPAAFFSRANDVLFYLPGLKNTLKDSTWERTFACRSTHARFESFASTIGAASVAVEIESTAKQLKSRYENLQAVLSEGLIRSAKDVGEGGLLTAVFEMTLGRNLGVHFEKSDLDPLFWLGEGLGAFVFGVDPHLAHTIEQRVPDAKRLGVTVNVPCLRWSATHSLDTNDLREAYLAKTKEGFWG